MRKLLLFTMVAAGTLLASASAPELRSASRTASGIKEINRAQHAVLVQAAASKVKRAEAPANAVEIPFTHDMGKTGTEIKNYTFIDANGDDRKWQYGKVAGYSACMAPNAADIDNNDDWLFSVPIHITPGDYVVSYEVGMMGSGALAVEMNVTLGLEPTIEAATIEVTPTTKFTDVALTKHEYNVSISEEGYYYLGFHCTTAKTDKGALKLANVGMRSGSVEPPVVVDPAAAGELTYTLAPKGELSATLRYVAPTLTKTGKPLEEITKVELTSRWGVDKYTFENVTPGQEIIQDVPLYEGINNRFTGVAYVGEVAGEMVEYKSIWGGLDTPLTPENVRLSVNPDYTSATLSWDAVPEVGEHGGYVDPDKVTYYVFDAFGTYYDPAIYTTSQTSCTVDYATVDDQDFYAYQVTAGIEDLGFYSLDAVSNIIVAGQPDALPKRESFPGGLYEDNWLGNTAVKGSMDYGTITDEYFASLFDPEDPDSPTPLTSQDGDGGFYFWMPFEKDVAYGLISTRADISKADKPVLEFWYQGQGSLIEVYAGFEVDQLQLLSTIDLKENPTEGWTKATLPLDEFKAQGAVLFEIRLVGAHNDDEHIWSVPIDNISVRNMAEKDVRLVTFTGNTKANPGQQLKYSAHIENTGTAPSAPVATLTADGSVVATEEVAEMAPGTFSDVEFLFTVPFNAPETLDMALTLVLDGENATSDNAASEVLAVNSAPFATVSDLEATLDGSTVVLTWSHPVNESGLSQTVIEDFESDDYTPMSITGAGDWTVYDGDGKKTYSIFSELYNPFQTSPIGFQLFDNVVAEVPDQYTPDAVAHSGQRYMMAPSAQGAANDNWLISPELSGNAQTVTFWAKSEMISWPETIEIYYSTIDNTVASLTNKVEDFTGLMNYWGEDIVPEQWTLFTVDLPEGAKYFAIHHNSYDTLALLVDDVTYEAVSTVPADLELHGYHVFCNGEQITTDLHPHATFHHDSAAQARVQAKENAGKTLRYTVVPVYSHGVAPISNEATIYIEPSGIENIEADNAPEVIYNLQGIRVANPNTSGVYIRVKDGQAQKVGK